MSSQSSEARNLLEGINWLLKGIYDHPRRLSAILCEAGIRRRFCHHDATASSSAATV